MTDQQPHDAGAAKVDRPTSAPIYGFGKATGPQLTWEQVEARLREAQNYWLATVRPDGRPHVTPVWGAWVDGMLFVSGDPQAVWARNLTTNPACAAHLESGEEVVIVEGHAEEAVTDAALRERIVAEWNAKYGRLAPEPATDGIYRLRPRTVRAWTDADTFADATRWTWE